MLEGEPRRDGRLEGAALGIGLFVLFGALWIGASWLTNTQRQQETAQNTHIRPCIDAQGCNERALRLQAREAVTSDAMLELAFVQAAISFVGLIGLGATGVYAHRAWIQAKRSADAALRTFEAENRAWVTVRPLEAESFDWSNDSARIQIALEAENVGPKPAFDVRVSFAAYLGVGVGAGHRELDKLVEMELLMSKHSGIGDAIISGERRRQFVSCPVEMLPVPELPFTAPGQPDASKQWQEAQVRTLNGVCCVTYRSPNLEAIHTSTCFVWIMREDRRDFRPDNGSATKEELRTTFFGTRMT